MAASPFIVKITHGTDIRRFTSRADTLTWASVQKKVATLFSLTHTPFKVTYLDDENDMITVSSEEELTDAVDLALACTPSVLRLHVAADAPARAEASTQDALKAATSDSATQDVRATLEAGTQHAGSATTNSATSTERVATASHSTATEAQPMETDGSAAPPPDSADPAAAGGEFAPLLRQLAKQLPALAETLPASVRRAAPGPSPSRPRHPAPCPLHV